MFQTKEQANPPKKTLMEISNPPDKEFQVIVIKMTTKVRRKMDKHSKNFNKGKILKSTKWKL